MARGSLLREPAPHQAVGSSTRTRRTSHRREAFSGPLHVIEHVEYPRKLLYEAKRVAKYVFVEVPLEDTLRLSRDFVFDTVGHINFYSPKTIRRLIQTCNLRVLAQELSNPSKAVYTFRKGRKGLVNYYVKANLLRFLPSLATKIFTYHSAIIAEGIDGS